MTGILGLTKRLASDSGRIHWQPKHFEALAKHYRVDADQVAKLVAPTPPSTAFPPTMERKASPDTQRSFKFILNDGELDRSGDIVVAAGVNLDHFKKSPIALLQHDVNRPIGTWSGVHVSDGKLKGTLHLATDHIPLAEDVRSGIVGGVYRAISIGFLPDEIEFIKTGIKFHTWEMMEASVVAIGASRGALRERDLGNKADREEAAAEIAAKGREHSAKVEVKSRPVLVPVTLPPEVAEAKARLAQARARRTELKLIAGMDPNQHREYLDAKVAAKRERKARLEAIRGKS